MAYITDGQLLNIVIFARVTYIYPNTNTVSEKSPIKVREVMHNYKTRKIWYMVLFSIAVVSSWLEWPNCGRMSILRQYLRESNNNVKLCSSERYRFKGQSEQGFPRVGHRED